MSEPSLTEFLLARIAEDEYAASLTYETAFVGAVNGRGSRYDLALRMSPARVLAECEAKRGIVQLRHPDMMRAGEFAESSGDHWETFSDDRRSITREEFLAQRNVLRLLALPYADHPDYREEWRT